MKKTTKENPLTFFRKANEAREATVKKSLKKAQDGISMGPTRGTDVAPLVKNAVSNVYSGPITERDSKALDNAYPSTVGKNPNIKSRGLYSGKAIESGNRSLDENYLRSGNPSVQKWNDNQESSGENYPKTNYSTYKKGGSTKATKFAALAPPYNKATAADRIAGAKKNAKKK